MAVQGLRDLKPFSNCKPFGLGPNAGCTRAYALRADEKRLQIHLLPLDRGDIGMAALVALEASPSADLTDLCHRPYRECIDCAW